MGADLSIELALAVDAAREAGARLRAEFNRPGGPRGSGEHADVDREVELLLAGRLQAQFPDDGCLGEELDRPTGFRDRSGRVWLLDPNDGTAAFLEGYRGAAVSIALVENGVPILGVVHAYNYPDDDGDLIAWARGGPVLRNGAPVARRWPCRPGPDCAALLSRDADRNAPANARCVSPMRYRAVPCTAYRFALVAVGEGDVGASLRGPVCWDVAAGHALLLAAGGDLYNENGDAVRYRRDGVCAPMVHAFGGQRSLVETIRTRDWRTAMEPLPVEVPYALCRPRPGLGIIESRLLSRAQGCILGQLAGDALGSQVEFMTAAQLLHEYPSGLRNIDDGGSWDTIAGQPTDDSEMALVLARTLARDRAFEPEAARTAYEYWLASGPFDCGGAIRHALRGAPLPDSQANGALMRVSPIGIFGARADSEQVSRWAMQDAALTHPNPVCPQASALYATAVARAIRIQTDPHDLYARIRDHARDMAAVPALRESIDRAATEPPADYCAWNKGWVLIAFQNALWQLLHAESLESGLVDTVMRGGDTDTNGAIAGALLGAVYGRASIPPRWLNRVLTCRPVEGLHDVRRPRPQCFWPVDAEALAALLVTAGGAA